MSKNKPETEEKKPPVRSSANRRETVILSLNHDALVSFAIAQSRHLQSAKSLLRSAAKLFRWMQKPTEAQDIDKFLSISKDET